MSSEHERGGRFAFMIFATLASTVIAACGGGAEPGQMNADAGVTPDAGAPVDSGGAGGGAGDAAMFRQDAGQARCGNGLVELGESCDDGNDADADGCSATCALEPGFTCPTAGEPCEEPMPCGNAELDEGEACDDRNAAAGDGCDAQCEVEPGWECPTVGAACVAAQCGDAIRAGDEECDDGDTEAEDGCDDQCLLEPGYACPDAGEDCHETTCGDGVAEGTEQCDDGNFDTGDGCSPLCEAEPECSGGVCTSMCGDGLKLGDEECDDGNARSGDGCSADCMLEEGFDCLDTSDADPDTLEIPIVIRDFRDDHPDFEVYSGSGPTTGLVKDTLDEDAKPAFLSTHGSDQYGQQLTSEADFRQWYRGDDSVNQTIVQTLSLERDDDGIYVYDDTSFFPLDDLGFGNQGRDHNFHFTSEVRYWFEYEGGEELSFRGDDDVWVFVDGKLTVDLGGLHAQESGSVTLDAAKAAELGLEKGKIYEIVVFQAERHTTGSNYRLSLSDFTLSRTRCEPICGDGILTRHEACDDGVVSGEYGSCMPGCLERAGYCGDGELQSEHESCDDGNNEDGDGCAGDCQMVVIE